MQIMRIFGLRDNAYCQVFAFIYMYIQLQTVYVVWCERIFLVTMVYIP